MTTIYWAGGEDSDFASVVNSTMDNSNGSTYRSSFARGAVKCPTGSSGTPGLFAFTPNVITTASFWFHGQVFIDDANPNQPLWLLNLRDSGGTARIILRNDASHAGLLQICKVNASGTVTVLASTPAGVFPVSLLTPVDLFVNYAVSGQATLYVNQVQQATFSGDVTTDSVTQLASVQLGTTFSGGTAWWSEMILADSDTRTYSLFTMIPQANGNTHNFDTGSPSAPVASQVNEFVLDDTTWDGSTTAGQIDEYTLNAVPAGTFAVRAVGVSARMVKGTTGPSKADLAVRTGGSDFFSSDQSLTLGLANYQNWWVTNPNTSAAWTTSQIGAAAGFNIGVKSVT